MNRGGIRVFAALVRAGSLRLAGRELKMEHSTVVRRSMRGRLERTR